MKYKTMKQVLDAAYCAHEDAKAKERVAKYALLDLFWAYMKREGSRRAVDRNEHSLSFKPHNEEARECREMRDLLSRIKFYPAKVVVEVATIEGWWWPECYEEEWGWEKLTLIEGEEAEWLFDWVAKRFVEQAAVKGSAMRLFTEPGMPHLANYLKQRPETLEFEKDFETHKAELLGKDCGCAEECNCDIPF